MHLRRTVLPALATTLLLAGCGTTHPTHDMTGMSGMSSMPSMSSSMSGMPGMAHGDGLSDTVDGYTLRVLSAPMAGMTMPLRFTIDHDGMPATDLVREQTKLIHLYLIRDDLSGFQHLHPTRSASGSWTVTPTAPASGSYRVYVQFTARGSEEPTVLSTALDLGTDSRSPSAVPTGTATADGYTVALDARPEDGMLRLRVSRGGRPFAGLQPYLDTYAHVSAFREGDLAFSHLHPTEAVTSRPGGPDLELMADFPGPGTYRLFVQFRAGGALHTVPVSMSVG